MANEKTETHINELNEEQLNALSNLQWGIPEGVVPADMIKEFDERDLINRIVFTSPRSQIAIPGWALSEEGNKIVEELARRDREQALAEAGVPEPVAKPKKVKKEEVSDETD